MYNPVSIPKEGAGAACPLTTKPNIVLVPVDAVDEEPTRVVGDTALEGALTLEVGETAIGIYATPNSVELTEESEGDLDARGVKAGIAFEHPGDSKAIADFVEYNRNRGFIAIVTQHNGDKATVKLLGSIDNPLYLSVESTNNKEACKRKLTFKQEQRQSRGISLYLGVIPELAAVPVAPAPAEGV